MVILRDAEKTSDKIQHPFMIKNPQNTRNKLPQPSKNHLQKPTIITYLISKDCLLPNVGDKARMYLVSFQHHTGRSNQCSRIRKRNKRHWKGKLERLGKKIKHLLQICRHDYVENFKKST